MNQIKKVFVIHKTHLDIGFTNYAEDVLQKYVENFIPAAIDIANKCNKDGQKRFVWTVGSYIIKYFFDNASEENCKKLEKAIQDSYITWHGLSCTTHTELMDKDVLEYSIKIANDLNKRFNKTHIAAKMTDVPCHTAAIIPYLVKHGIKYLHIGINGSSKPIDIPEICILKYGNDSVIFNYAYYYGRPCIFKEYALEFAHTSDNMGPPTLESINEEMERLQNKYPNAQIISSSLDDFAQILLEHKDEFPIIDCELGDTWIHGAASDPLKTSIYCELLKIKNMWLESDLSKENYDAFMENLLLVCEHTWGMDVKKFLPDYKNYDKKDFQNARKADLIQKESLKFAGKLVEDFTLEEREKFKIENYEARYSLFEKSWDEQREYVYKAIELLPQELKSIAQEKVKTLVPEYAPIPFTKVECSNFNINGYTFEVQKNGSIKILQKEDKVFENTILGLLSYSTYSFNTVVKTFFKYNRDLHDTYGWSYPDFAKPGLEYAESQKDSIEEFSLESISRNENTVYVELKGSKTATEDFGCPRKARIAYTFSDSITVNVTWFDKDANKMPESLSFGFIFDDNTDLRLEKLGLAVNPLNIISGGNKKLHGCRKAESKGYSIENKHCLLLGIGTNNVYDVDDTYDDLKNGLQYILYNNRWNTNFRLYYEENASFDFNITLN